ncbi:MAG: DEAD/DEAH box helicase [Polyangiaceae bacterium]|nr:DEAD/DEAH box helicase [Polyangiaceae bacterium]
MPAPPWSRPRGLDAVVAHWLGAPATRACVAAHRVLPEVLGRHGCWPQDLAPSVLSALGARGAARPYLHQRQAVDLARAGRDVVIATPTASGKSLCFHVPVFEALAREPGARALYLYPTKALSRDQEASVRALLTEAGLCGGASVYDGDTPGDARRTARDSATIIMTNPDMLHSGILPQHTSWARLFENLRYVVVDELHTYRGVFGSHVAHVLARLRRVAAFHGARPTFIAATATIGNAREHAARLFGTSEDEVEVVSESSAPRGARQLLVYNPPVVNAELGLRSSTLKSAVRLTTDLVRAGVRTLVFGPSRNAVEIMLKYLRDAFVDEPSVSERIFAYRSGYLPESRRRIERGLRQGEVAAVVATSALELGIDIGELDAVVCAGYPGSLADTWQRFGRAGRRAGTSLSVLVCSSDPLDQYLARHPEYLLDGSVEHARVDPGNTEVAIQHLKCAAFELAFRFGEAYRTLGDDTAPALDYLAEHGVVHAGRERYHWASDAFPANHVSLRRVGWDNFVIIDEPTGIALGELDWHAAPGMLHEQAIYQHDGAQYQVERLDYENHKAFVRLVEPDYFTTALRHRKVSVLDESARASLGCALAAWGEVSVTEKVVGYKKVKFHTHENAGYGDVRLPDIDMHTTSFWLTLPAHARRDAELGRSALVEGLTGLGRALELAATLALMCDGRDIGSALCDAAPPAETHPRNGEGDAEPAERSGSRPVHRLPGGEPSSEDADGDKRFEPTLYLFDNVPGGVGLAERIFERAAELLAQAGALILSCPCRAGCPACVGATATGLELDALHEAVAGAAAPATVAALPARKQAALAVLALLRPAADAPLPLLDADQLPRALPRSRTA